MNRYLTDRATAKRIWHIPVAMLSILFSAVTVSTWIEDSPAGESFGIWLAAYIFVVGMMLAPLIGIVRSRLRQREARRVADRLTKCGKTVLTLIEADKLLGVRNCETKIAKLKKHGLLQRIEIEGTNIVLDPETAAPTEPEPAPVPEDHDDVIHQIRYLNDEIDDAAVSERIDRIEHATAGILRMLDERPERADDARRFMSYYLPTTLKLLESYRLMEKQSYRGENIQSSMRSIEAVLDKLASAAEAQQDKLFGAEALDVEAEISVVETMMAADGLTGSGDAPLVSHAIGR